ncbi:MAG: type VI secretion system protein ImpK [Gammaproteobacteria bacterium]|jgi:type VI secretion system protein ImpK
MQDDDLSKTMIIPNPGGRRKSASTQGFESPPTAFSQPNNVPEQVNLNASAQCDGENIILSCASDLVILASHIRSLEPSNSIEQLRRDIETLITKFDQQINQFNLGKEVGLTARYLICCLVDELVLSTPWGSDSVWSQQTLLSKYHNESSGGEKFFLIVNKLLEQPQRNIDLIELCYVCLSSGFCGKYRISKQGESELLQISQKLYAPIEQIRPIGRDLSPTWQGVGNTKTGFVKQFPLPVFFLVLGFILLAVYIAFLSSLKAKVEPLYQKIESIGWEQLIPEVKDVQSKRLDINSVADSLKRTLGIYIEDKVVSIDVRNDQLIIRFVSTSLFKSGSSAVNEEALPDVNILVNAIKNYADRVLVIGHTDSTGKADSNWVISRKRAEAIAKWLTKSNQQLPNTMTRGVADTQPLVNNESDYNQSINRRVELTLILKDDII